MIIAVKGIIEFLLSENKEAEKIKKSFVVDIFPYGNPDGTVLGKTKTNAQGINIFAHADQEKDKIAPEVSYFWKWIKKYPPFLYINFHGWTACEKGKEPYEGSLRPALPFYQKWSLENKVLECDQSLIENADPISRYEKIYELGESCSENILSNLLAAKYGTMSYIYEPNMGTGPFGCEQKGVKVLRALAAPFL